MKGTSLRKTLAAVALTGATAVGAPALAQGATGFDMGPAMMGFDGAGFGMGTGMTDGYVSDIRLNLSAGQREQIAEIQLGVRASFRELMRKMQAERLKMNEWYYSDPRDEAAVSKTYRNMSELRQQMFDLSLRALQQIDAVLTPAQREELRQG